MKKLSTILFLFAAFSVNAQRILTMEGTAINDVTTDNWSGISVDRNIPTTFTYRNNSLTSSNSSGYMLRAGEELPGSYSNNLDGQVITGNKVTWNGKDMASVTHAIFTGYNINSQIKYNFLENTPYGIVQKANGMTDVSGVISYNIFKNPTKRAVTVKGINGIKIYNNTFYSNHTKSQTSGHGLIQVYSNNNPVASSTGTKIKNNIFYTVNQIVNIYIEDAESAVDFESDYNVFYCEVGTPVFNYLGTSMTFTQWQKLGFDTHSVVVNPRFTNTNEFIPASRLNYGIILDSIYQTGLSTTAKWVAGSSPATTRQNGKWQVGAITHPPATYYLSPSGNDITGKGSIDSPWFTINRAWKVVEAGDTVYLRGGTYKYNVWQNLKNKSGTVANYIHVFAFPGENPVITRGLLYKGYSMIHVSGNYLHFKGLEISNVLHTPGAQSPFGSAFYFENSNYCIWENINYYNNGSPAVLRGNSTGNLILNCDFHHNYDPWTKPAYGNADGLNVDYMPLGVENTVRGCRFWNNADDGIDLWENEGSTVIENCWAWANGYREDGTTTGGDGCGIKLGKTVLLGNTTINRTVQNCLSFYNRVYGISQNAAYCKMHVYNNTTYGNYERGIYFSPAWGNAASIFKNNIDYKNTNTVLIGQKAAEIGHNSWNGFTVINTDFISLDTTGVSGPRQADGSLPDINFLKLKEGSALIDAGTDVGIPFVGSAPDLGAFEYTVKIAQIPSKYSMEDISVCEGSSYEGWTNTGQYQRTLNTVSGADSIVTTNLQVIPAIQVTEEITINQGESYLNWNSTGTYKRTINSVTGCDSIVTTYLTVTAHKDTTENIIINKTFSEEINICEGDSYNGWTTSGQYQRILKAASGADSIVTTNLLVNPVIKVVEDITILEGENYLGWTISGVYHRTLSSSSGCDSLVTTNISVKLNKYSSEYISICDGESYNDWSASGQYQRILKSKDGTDSIVTTNLIVNPAFLFSEDIKIQEGESYNGWFSSGQYKRVLNSVAGCDSVIITDLWVEPVQKQFIELTEGWNIFSTYLTPSKKSFDDVFENLKINNLLIEVQDENGKFFRESDDGWFNEIGETKESEGYKIRVKSSCVLEIQGQPVVLPLNIQLYTGLNIISFPFPGEADAMKFIQSLIDEGVLEKIQDEKGNSIEYWGSSIGWINGIGNLIAGEGYLINVNKGVMLTIPQEFEKSGMILPGQTALTHFKKNFEGNGFSHMNINITGLNEFNLQVEDEIAAYDGIQCVGAVKLSESNISNNIVSIQVSAADKDFNNGFTEGNSVRIRVWQKKTDQEFEPQPKVIKGNNMYKKHGSVFFQMPEKKRIETSVNPKMEVNMYPNPAHYKVTLQFSAVPVPGTKIILTDRIGNLITTSTVQSQNEYLDIESQPSGIYFVKIVCEDYCLIKKLMIH